MLKAERSSLDKIHPHLASYRPLRPALDEHTSLPPGLAPWTITSSSSPDRKKAAGLLDLASRLYLADWLVVVVLALIDALLLLLVRPYPRSFDPADPAVRYPLRSQSVPMPILLVVCICAPVASFLCFFASATKKSKKAAQRELSQAVLGLIQAASFATFLTTCFKLYAGRPRPNFISLCEYANGHCTKHFTESRSSFPSGHASFAFATLGFLSLYLLGKLRLSARQTSFQKNDSSSISFTSVLSSASSIRLIMGLSPLFVACLIAISRTRDYWHDFSDINCGVMIGALCAILCYRTHFPSIFALNGSDRPYSDQSETMRDGVLVTGNDV